MAVWTGFIVFWDIPLLEETIQYSFRNITNSSEPKFQPKLQRGWTLFDMHRTEDIKDLTCDPELWTFTIWIEIFLILYILLLIIFYLLEFFINKIPTCCSKVWSICQCCSNKHTEGEIQQLEQKQKYSEEQDQLLKHSAETLAVEDKLKN